MMGKLERIMHSTYVILIALTGGILTGIYLPSIVPPLKAFGTIYVSLLKMCVIPIIMGSVSVSLARLFRSNLAKSFLLRMTMLFLVAMLAVAFIAPVLSLVAPSLLKPNDAITLKLSKIALKGNSDTSVADSIGFTEVNFNGGDEVPEKQSLASAFLDRLIPQNVFEALASGETLKIVLFFSLFGISLALVPVATSESVLAALEGIYKTAQFMVQKILLVFPFGLWAITAGQFATFGFSLVSALTSVLLFIGICTLLIVAITLLVIRVKTGIRMGTILKSIKEMVIIAMGTCNSFASVPMGIKGLTETLGMESYRVEGPFTLAVTLCRHGNILVISAAALFAMYLYSVPITISLVLYIAIASIFAAAAGTGAPGIIARSMVSVVILPLGIPAEIIILMLQVMDPFIDPMTSLLNVLPNYAIGALMGAEGAKREEIQVSEVIPATEGRMA